MTVDPRKFLLNTDYEMDKIIYYTSGTAKVSEGWQKSIPHNLGFIPLIFGVCAFNSDFSDPKTIPYEYPTQQNTIFFYARATRQAIKLEFADYNTPSRVFYYRIYGFEPSDSSATIAPTGNSANKFILNTDYNYCKLCKKGILNGDGAVSHNLGYVPQVLAWQEGKDPSDNNTWIFPIENSTPSDPIFNQPYQIRVTTSEITSQNIGKVHYRIYYDEA